LVQLNKQQQEQKQQQQQQQHQQPIETTTIGAVLNSMVNGGRNIALLGSMIGGGGGSNTLLHSLKNNNSSKGGSINNIQQTTTTNTTDNTISSNSNNVLQTNIKNDIDIIEKDETTPTTNIIDDAVPTTIDTFAKTETKTVLLLPTETTTLPPLPIKPPSKIHHNHQSKLPQSEHSITYQQQHHEDNEDLYIYDEDENETESPENGFIDKDGNLTPNDPSNPLWYLRKTPIKINLLKNINNKTQQHVKPISATVSTVIIGSYDTLTGNKTADNSSSTIDLSDKTEEDLSNLITKLIIEVMEKYGIHKTSLIIVVVLIVMCVLIKLLIICRRHYKRYRRSKVRPQTIYHELKPIISTA
jgi:hypothetical protein